MSVKFERKLPLILSVVFLLLSAIGFIYYQNTRSVQSAIEWEKHSHEVLLKLDETLALTMAVSTATGNFVILGSETYLEPYNRAIPKIKQNISTLRSLVADNPEQLEELNHLEVLITSAIAEADRKVALRKSEGFELAIVELSTQKGTALADGIQASIEKIKKIEIGMSQHRGQTFGQRLDQTVWIFIVGSLAGLISLAVVNVLVLFEIRRRRAAELALTEVNAGLEEKVAIRTEELMAANINLHEIGYEREDLLKKEQAARNEAEIANRLRDEFMATVSHELRTPLNSILGWSRLIKSGSLDSEQSEKAIGTIIKCSETQNRLIEDLMDVARLISGHFELHFETISPSDIIGISIESVKPTARAKDISIENRTFDKPPQQKISGDRDRLLQVFSNLLANAVKFSPQGSTVTVDTVEENGFIAFIIADNGVGITEEFLPIVFDRFRRDRTTSTKNGGLGLGLAIVRHLVEGHGGSVTAASDGKGKGATFTVRLPIKQAQASH